MRLKKTDMECEKMDLNEFFYEIGPSTAQGDGRNLRMRGN